MNTARNTSASGAGNGVGESGRKTRVLIVDDSALIRRLMTDILASDPDIEVVGTASDPLIAREKIKSLNPDVITLDVEMPRMDGLSFLQRLMRLRPMPVVMVSSLTEASADVTLQALAAGAVDFVTKPSIDIARALDDHAQEVREKVKLAPLFFRRTRRPAGSSEATAAAAPVQGSTLPFRATEQIVAMGASTGGTEALDAVIRSLPSDFPGIVAVQHIPASFSAQFAKRVDAHAAMIVREAVDGERILAGHAYIARGDRHLEVVRDGAIYRCRLSDAAPVNRHKPSVDVLFRSVCTAVGGNAVGVILTGMGSDGARGLLEMKRAGAHTIAQDEASSVVWGMPQSAIELGAADVVLPLDKIGLKLRSLFSARMRDADPQGSVAASGHG